MNTMVTGKWIKWGILNLSIVALYGLLMRYKIAFSFPFFDQKNLLHAHSHFAFSGWISHALYSGLAALICDPPNTTERRKYNRLLLLNLICSFGMLLAFTIQGYKAASIVFSTLSIVIAILFASAFIKDAKKETGGVVGKSWAVAGLLLNVLSAAGPVFLAYMMVTKSIDHPSYLGSVYYFLHFQYNGWFFFGSMALVTSHLPKSFGSLRRYFNVFIATVIPTFFLSVLWLKLPYWLYGITAVASLLQLVVWLVLCKKLWIFIKRKNVNQVNWFHFLFYTACIALSVKFILQAISVVPSLSQLVFGIRPIVIAYLHLILLGVYSVFLLGYCFGKGYLNNSRLAGWGYMDF